jgi:hypothetical protein
MADKAPQATRKQAEDLQAAILVVLRNGGMVVGEGAPGRWRLKESARLPALWPPIRSGTTRTY